MKTDLIIEGIGCVKCSDVIEEKVMAKSTVEKIFSGLHKKMIFVHRNRNSSTKKFLSSLAELPHVLREIVEAANCQCCKEIQFDFPVG